MGCLRRQSPPPGDPREENLQAVVGLLSVSMSLSRLPRCLLFLSAFDLWLISFCVCCSSFVAAPLFRLPLGLQGQGLLSTVSGFVSLAMDASRIFSFPTFPAAL